MKLLLTFYCVSLAATDSLLNPPPKRLRPKQTFQHPPGRTQGACKIKWRSEGERQGQIAGREGRQQPEYLVTRDNMSQQASLPKWTTSVHAEATAGKCTHTQVGQWIPTHTVLTMRVYTDYYLVPLFRNIFPKIKSNNWIVFQQILHFYNSISSRSFSQVCKFNPYVSGKATLSEQKSPLLIY